MKYPLFFYVAFLLGIHTHSGTSTKPYFVACGFVCLIFLVSNNLKSVYELFYQKPDSFVMMLVFYRAFLGPYFIIAGSLDCKSDKINCARILKEMTEVNRKKIQRTLLIYFLYFTLIGVPDVCYRASTSTNILDWVLGFLTGLISRTICVVTVTKFTLLSETLKISYSQLNDDITHTYSRIAEFTISRMRARHLEICEFEKEVNDAFGLRVFVWILMLQLGVVEITHTIIDEVMLEKYSGATGAHVYVILDFFVTVLVLSLMTWNTSEKVSDCVFLQYFV